MSDALIQTTRISTSHEPFLRAVGDIYAYFGSNTQDSGNESYGVSVDGSRYFVKTAGDPNAPLAGPKSPTHEQRIDALRNAVALRQAVDHESLPVLHRVIESATGPMLVYEWLDGEHLGRGGSGAAHARFKALHPPEICAALSTIYAAHVYLEEAGYVACDFYDGALIYDFEVHRMYLMDLDMYSLGPFTNGMGRLFGSSRFMAPEEFELDATIDHRTTVFNMGRTAAVLLSDMSLNRAPFRGTDAQYEVMTQACHPDPTSRYPDVKTFHETWLSASP